jgi:glycosyltransferase involved in cell wall biosynthesis
LGLAGGTVAQNDSIAKLARALGVADRVRLLGWVGDGELPALYAKALCFVHPSQYESFGFQLTEAMALGCPVLAARATCLPEILGSGGDYFSLEDPADFGHQLRAVASDNERRQRLKERALARSKNFSWSKTADETLGIYEDLVAGVL